MEPIISTDPRLLHAFAFTGEDLLANRRGSLTPRQERIVADQAKVSGCSSRIAWVVFLGTAALLVSAPLLLGEGEQFQQVWPYLGGAALLFLGIVSVFMSLDRRRRHQLRMPQLRMAAGVVARSTKRIRHGRWHVYYAHIGGVRFQLATERQYQALDEGKHYRVYYIPYPPTQLILSIEEGKEEEK